MLINENTRTLAENLTSVSSGWPSDYRESIQYMLESFVPLLIERSSVERDFIAPLIDGSNGLPTLSKGIL